MEKDEVRLGYWWFPGEEEQRWAGNLTFRANGDIHLEILAEGFASQASRQTVIHGVASQDTFTLLGLVNSKFTINMGSDIVTTSVYSVTYVLTGAYLVDYGYRFPSFSFSIEGLQEWSRLSGIYKEMAQVGETSGISRQYSHSFPETVQLGAGDYNFRVTPVVSEPASRWSFGIQEDTQIYVHSAKPKTIPEWMSDVVLPFQRLVQLSVKIGGRIQRMEVSDTSDGQKTAENFGQWFPLSTSFAEPYPFEQPRSTWEQPLLDLHRFNEVPDSLAKWFNIEKTYREPLAGALDAVRGDPTADYVLFVYSRLLERLASRYPQSELCNKPTIKLIASYAKVLVKGDDGEALSNKIRSQRRNDARVPLKSAVSKWVPHIIPQALDEEIDWIVTKVITTRNHFAHQGHQKLTKKHIQPGEVLVFTSLVATLVDCEIVDQLGFDVPEILKRVEESRQFKRARVVHDVWAATHEDAESSE